MANVILNIGTTDNSSLSASSSVVYKDIAMISDKTGTVKRYHNGEFILDYDPEPAQLSDTAVQEESQPYVFKVITPTSGDDVTKKIVRDYVVTDYADANAVQNSLHNIFTFIPGQRLLTPEFGNKLYQHLYNAINTYNVEQIITEIRNCFIEWEPRANFVKAVDISDTNDTEHNTVKLQIYYTIPTLTSKEYKDKVFTYTYEYNRNSTI